MSKPAGLTVVECPYCYAGWSAEIRQGETVFSSVLRPCVHPQAADLYRREEVYQKAGFAPEFCRIDHEAQSQCPPHEGLTRAFVQTVRQGLEKGNNVFLAGGYCNYAPAVLGGMAQALEPEQRLGLVWMDAHADNRILEKQKGPLRLVSVPMAVLTGQTMPEFRRQVCGLEKPLDGRRILASDIRIMDESCAQNLIDAGVRRLDASQFDREEVWRQAVEELAGQTDALYLAVDADILKPELIPAYEKSVPYGHDLETVARNIRIVMETGKVRVFSAFCFDFDKGGEGDEQNRQSALTLTAAALQSWSRRAPAGVLRLGGDG